jgi:hypothetical protein
MEKDDRRGDNPGRRRTPQNDYASKCPWCDMKDEQSKERWANHLKEEFDRQMACSELAKELKGDLRTLREKDDSKTSNKSFFWIAAVFIAVIGWLYVDHFGLSKSVSFNTGVIQEMKADLKMIVDNQERFMKFLGVQPISDKK